MSEWVLNPLNLFAGQLFVIVEYAPHGNLRQFLRERRLPSQGYQQPKSIGSDCNYREITIRDFISFSFQIARGMGYLADRKVCRTDWRSQNRVANFLCLPADYNMTKKHPHCSASTEIWLQEMSWSEKIMLWRSLILGWPEMFGTWIITGRQLM